MAIGPHPFRGDRAYEKKIGRIRTQVFTGRTPMSVTAQFSIWAEQHGDWDVDAPISFTVTPNTLDPHELDAYEQDKMFVGIFTYGEIVNRYHNQ